MPWNDTLDNDARAAAAAKGWDRLNDIEAAQTIFKSYVNLEKTRPDPARTIVLPQTPDDPAWSNVWEKLGAPKDAAGYTFEGVTFKDGSVPEANFLDFVKETAAKYHLPADTARKLAADLAVFTDTVEEQSTADLQARIVAGETALKGTWGDAYDNNVTIAARAFGVMGLEKEVVDTLVENLGVEKVMALGYDLGKKMGEPELLKGTPNVSGDQNAGGGGSVLTREEAVKEKNRLVNDTEFGKKLMAGDREALKQLENITKQIVGTPDNWESPPENWGHKMNREGKFIENV